MNYLAFWDQDDLNNPLLLDIKVVDDVEKHSKLVSAITGGNVSFRYVPIHVAHNAQEIITRLYNLVNAVECRGVDHPSSYEALDLYIEEAKELLSKLNP